MAFVLTRGVCLALQDQDRELVRHGVETGQIVRLPNGAYVELHQPLDAHRRSEIVNVSYPEPLVLGPDGRGQVTRAQRLRVWLSHRYLDGALTPLPQGELEAPNAAAPTPAPSVSAG